MLKNKNLKLNIIFIFIFLIFLFSFSSVKKTLKPENKDINFESNLENKISESDLHSDNLFILNIKNLFKTKSSLLSKIQDLENQLELEKIKNINNFFITENKDEKIIIAKKIFSDFSGIYDTILINKGLDNKVKEDDIVFIYPDKAIGKIESVNKNNSLITLFSKSGNKIEGVLRVIKNSNTVAEVNMPISQEINLSTSTTENNDSPKITLEEDDGISQNIIVDLVGYGGGDFIFNLPENIEVSTGTLVYLSKDKSKVLGEVIEIKKQEASFFETILVRGYYNSRINESFYIK